LVLLASACIAASGAAGKAPSRSPRGPTSGSTLASLSRAPSLATAPQLSFVASAPVLVFHRGGTATTTVEVLNPGPRVLVRFVLVPIPVGRRVAANPGWVAQHAAGLNSVALTFNEAFDQGLTGASVEVSAVTKSSPRTGSGPLPADPTAVPMRTPYRPSAEAIVVGLHRLTGAFLDFWVPVFAGLGLACLFLALTISQVGCDSRSYVTAGSSWNFKDSWATNLTAVGATAGTFLTAAGSTSTLLRGIQTSSFALLFALWGSVIVLAPLILAYANSSAGASTAVAGSEVTTKFVRVKLLVLLGAGGLTLFAVGAELATAGVVVHEADASTAARVGAYSFVGVVGLLLLGYAVSNTVALVKSSRGAGGDPTKLASRMQTGADTSLAQ
jgi:hypothetical protein